MLTTQATLLDLMFAPLKVTRREGAFVEFELAKLHYYGTQWLK
jgi:hypothetical protein